ncbi:MAG: hypothetical protein HFH27_00185 [Clostridiaceae bacterium]|nr:hypothetical protein [Clostridiaceae bacterium]MCI9482860.1 hypothetical protein [Clostridiaceae bacterium]
MEREKKKIKLYRRRRNSNTVVVLVGAVALLYIIAQTIYAFSNHYVTVSATRVTVEDSIECAGIFIRDELLADQVTSQTVKHLVSTGERVKKQSQLAVVYAGESALETSQELEQLEEEVALLRAALRSAGDFSDTARLDQQLTTTMRTLSAQVRDGIVTDARDTADSLREQSLRRAAGSLETEALSAELEALERRRDSLSSQVSGQTRSILSPATGYFSETIDGYEGILTKELLETLSYEELVEIMEADRPAAAQEQALGKIVRGFSWYFAVPLEMADARRVRAGSRVKVRFSQTGEAVDASVYAIRKSDDEEHALVILSGDRFSASIVSLREQEIDLILGTYTGLKVPKEAVRVSTETQTAEDGTETVTSKIGVYIMSGSFARFKEISQIYEADTYYVVRQEVNTVGANNALVMQDLIIVQGKEIEDRKVLK